MPAQEAQRQHATTDDGPRVCPECSERFVYTRAGRPGAAPVFCTVEHKRAWNNRQLTRAAPLMILMQSWRQGRHRKGSKAAKHALTELCLAIDAATAEDRAAGRPATLDVYEARLRRQGLSGLVT